MQKHHESEAMSLRDRAGLIAANLIAVATLVTAGLNAPELLMLVIR